MADDAKPEIRRGIYEAESLLEVCSRSFAGLFRLWNDKRAGRSMPARSDLDPTELKPWLGRLGLLDVLPGPPMDFRYRLCGTRTVEEYGLDLTGKRLSEVCYVGSPVATQAVLSEFVRIGRPRYRNDPVTDLNGFALLRERIYLPLGEDGRTINMILYYQESNILVHPRNRVRSIRPDA